MACPPHLTSLVDTWQVGIVIGIAFANFLTAPSSNIFGTMDKWRYTFLVPSVCSLFQLCVLPFCPESPSFLIKAKGSQLALSTLRQLHRAESAAMHMNNLRGEMQEGGKAGDDMSITELLMAKHLRKQVMVGIVIKIGVQVDTPHIPESHPTPPCVPPLSSPTACARVVFSRSSLASTRSSTIRHSCSATPRWPTLRWPRRSSPSSISR